MERREAAVQAVSVLPREMRVAVLTMMERESAAWEEIRLRAGRGLWCVDSEGREHRVSAGGRAVTVSAEDLRLTAELATRSSFQSAAEKLAAGFLPLRGGHRLGLTGTAAVREGSVLSFRTLSSLNIRIACPVTGVGEGLLSGLMEGERFANTLILAPPGQGKTTLLRDLIRLLSLRGIRVGLADERSEVAALYGGVPQLEVGSLTDVVDGCPKGEGLLLLLRSMSPQVLAADEISCPADVNALMQGRNWGVPLLATAHGLDLNDLRGRGVYAPLLEEKVFSRVVTIRRKGGTRSYVTERIS